MSSSNVLIIGAGAAGLAAAKELSRKGIAVTILEARNRIGGRIQTARQKNSTIPIELGAEFIHGKAPELLQISNEASLTLCDVSERHWLFQNRRLKDNDEFFSTMEEVTKKMAKVKKDQSFQDFLHGCDISKEHSEMLMLYVEGYHAAHTERISVRGLNLVNNASKEIEDEKQFRIVDGYDRVVLWLYDKAISDGVSFHFNSIVREIHWSKNSVIAVTDSGGKFSARFVLLTVPLPIFQNRSIRFQPAIPEKEKAAQKLAMGNVIKTNFIFRERFWEGLKLSGKSLFDLGFIHAPAQAIPTWWTQLPLRTPVLVGWTGGPGAEQLLGSDAEIIFKTALDSLGNLFRLPRKEIEDLLEDSYTHNWHADTFSCGAYSYIPVGGLNAASELAKPVENTLFFAGEAANTEGHAGTVNGAIATGLRAARQILKLINT